MTAGNANNFTFTLYVGVSTFDIKIERLNKYRRVYAYVHSIRVCEYECVNELDFEELFI